MAEHIPPWLRTLQSDVHDEWAESLGHLEWSTSPREVWEPPTAPGTAGAWFPGGRIDVVWNLVHRHAAEHGDRIALHWEGEPGDRRSLTYGQLSQQVEQAARALRGLGVDADAVVALHTGWLPETVVTMLACMSIGASWSMLPVSLPPEALGTRIDELSPTVLLTQDGAWRRGAVLPLKNRADEALASTAGVEATIVVRRTGMDVPWFHGDHWFSDLIGSGPSTSAAAPDPAGDGAQLPAEGMRAAGPVPGMSAGVPADHVLCTRQQASGAPTTRLTQHSAAGVLMTAAAFHAAVRTGPVFWCAADVSWAVSTWHGFIGPLLFGDTVVVYEGTLDVPDQLRTLDVVERYGVSTLVSSPSVMRTLRSWNIDAELSARGSTLRRLVTAGEPVEPGLRGWMEKTFSGTGCEVADGWGQVELNGIVHVNGQSTLLDTAHVAALGEDGKPIRPGESGQLVLRLPTPGSLVLADALADGWEHQTADALGFTEDLVTAASDGSLHFRGRMDAVVSVSGQLISLEAVARSLLEHPFVSAATALRAHRENSGSTIIACVVADGEPGAGTARELIATVNAELGGLARPRMIVFVDRMTGAIDRGELTDALVALVPSRTAWAVRTWDEVLEAVCTTARGRGDAAPSEDDE